MPFYEYECRECVNSFEVQQSINSEPLELCKKCNTKSLRRVIHASPIHFKGTGFYITDYKKK